MAKLLLEKPDVLLLDEPTNFLDKDHVFSLKDSFTKYTSKATTIGRAQGLMQKHFLRPCALCYSTLKILCQLLQTTPDAVTDTGKFASFITL